MICDQKPVRHTPPHNLADSLRRPAWNEAKESGARGQESGVRTTPLAKLQGVPPKTPSQVDDPDSFTAGIFSQGMNESKNHRNLPCIKDLCRGFSHSFSARTSAWECPHMHERIGERQS